MNITQDKFYNDYVDDDLNLIIPKELNDKINDENLTMTSLYYLINGVLNDNDYEISDIIKEKADYYFSLVSDISFRNRWEGRIARNERFMEIISNDFILIDNNPNILLEIYKNNNIFALLNDCIYDLDKYNTKLKKRIELEEILKNI